jgi:hypothetical protein
MLALLAVQAQQTVLEVIELNYRNAEQVIPMLSAAGPGGTISGMQNRIVVRTTPQNLADCASFWTWWTPCRASC